ncbi:MAG: hypothetical protein U5K75_03200 [Ahrensia sp.]|nr:hypothetical protein [Ahrensia sp.]
MMYKSSVENILGVLSFSYGHFRLKIVLLGLCAILPNFSLADEKDFFYLPKSADVRQQIISRAGNERDWPFTVDEGTLTCLYAAGTPLILFWVEDGFELDGVTPKLRSVTVSMDPVELIFGNMFVNDLIAEDGATPERRMALFRPIYEVGKRLCDQPKGSDIGPGEL